MSMDSTVQPGTELSRQQVDLGRIVTDLDGVWRLAQNMARSTIVPKDFISKPENILVAIQLGAEIGLAPMQALQSIAVINGRPSIWGDGLLALVVSSHLCEGVEETFDERTLTATCVARRKGWTKPITHSFSKVDAEKAGLMTKDTYKNYLRRMLQMRARSWALRDAFPDVLRGLASAEEAQDMLPAIDVVAEGTVATAVSRLMPVAPAATAPAATVAAPARVTEQPAQPAAEEKSDIEVALEAANAEIERLKGLAARGGEPTSTATAAPAETIEPGKVDPPAPVAADEPMIEDADRRRLIGAARNAGATVDQLKAWLDKKHGIQSTKAIKVAQFAALFAAVGNIKADLEQP